MKSQNAILITGAAQRIGKDIALYLAKSSYDIALHYNSSREEAIMLKDEIEILGVKCEIFKADLTDVNACKKLVKETVEQFPNLIGVINNASIFKKGGFTDTEAGLLDEHFAVNLRAPFFISQEYSNLFQGKGCVVNIIDCAVKRNSKNFVAYMLSKKSLYDFTKIAALNLAPNIRVNGISPGAILPAIDMDETRLKAKSKQVPLQKLGSTKAIAEATKFFVENDSITGQIIDVDGGESLLW